MLKLRTLTALATTGLALAAAPAALAATHTVGNSSGNPTSNMCVAQIDCTYVNYHNGKPSDVIKQTGKLKSWTLNAGSIGGTVRLRILQPTSGGGFKIVQSSSTKVVNNAGNNTYSANIPVKSGDVLALTNDTSGLYMSTASSSHCLRFWMGTVSGKPTDNVSMLHLLLSAKVNS